MARHGVEGAGLQAFVMGETVPARLRFRPWCARVAERRGGTVQTQKRAQTRPDAFEL